MTLNDTGRHKLEEYPKYRGYPHVVALDYNGKQIAPFDTKVLPDWLQENTRGKHKIKNFQRMEEHRNSSTKETFAKALHIMQPTASWKVMIPVTLFYFQDVNDALLFKLRWG